jgi:excisionase family DNA binding protein
MTRMSRTDELAKRLSCSRETVRRMCRKGEIPCVRVRRTWRVDVDAAILALSRDGKTNTDGK